MHVLKDYIPTYVDRTKKIKLVDLLEFCLICMLFKMIDNLIHFLEYIYNIFILVLNRKNYVVVPEMTKGYRSK